MLVLAESDGLTNERLAAELADVEARFQAELLSDLPCVNELANHVERYRGKMLRPTLVLLSAMATDSEAADPTPDHRVLATVVEMIHMATLVHDDILDEARIRRQGATVNQLAGNEAAVMLGDYLISHAYHLCSSLDRPDLSRRIAQATNTVCEGELLQLANRNHWQLEEPTYFEIIRRKTASLCGVCCREAARLNGAGAGTAEALDAYGEKLGVAFQIVDDVLDLTGEESAVGKTLGRDLEKGKMTLPLILHLQRASERERAELEGLLAGPADSARGEADRHHQAEALREHLAESDAVADAQARARELVAEARRRILSHLHESPSRRLMLEMADAVLDRKV